MRAPTPCEKYSCLEAHWEEHTTSRWPAPHGAVVQNGAVGVEEPGAVTDSEQVTQTPIRVEATSTTIEVPAASRLWWNFDLMCRSKKVIPKEWVLEKQSTENERCDNITRTCDFARHLGPH